MESFGLVSLIKKNLFLFLLSECNTCQIMYHLVQFILKQVANLNHYLQQLNHALPVWAGKGYPLKTKTFYAKYF